MVHGKFPDELTPSRAHDDPAVANIGDKALSAVEEDDDGAGTGFINFTQVGLIEVGFLAFLETCADGLFHAIGEAGLGGGTCAIWR